ncbi:MAG TPA: DUF4091 domain-containing protein [Kiritimatiellia bacterium]|nr:DUF4091 domain-containing protein [Kiritimatiellia bacterium]HRZ11124.1 DUF4091 domain-containing protein [Kiritimatiellia bacterium]HSA19504.1 DUF4091 domain-containing protein [Kiritimatiellia bacterium]
MAFRRRAAIFGFLLLSAAAGQAQLTAIWANDGGDKVARSECRASANPGSVTNSLWDGSSVRLFGARNEVLGFALILEAASAAATNVSVVLTDLNRGDYRLRAAPAPLDGLFAWTNREIELFYLRYLQIQGLSQMAYETYDERHIPQRLRRPWTGEGEGEGYWTNRPDHDQFYPDIAVPMELVPRFDVAAGESQVLWADVYIPKTTPAGAYTGAALVAQGGATQAVPVSLRVLDFALPDEPAARTMVYLGYRDLNVRYLDEPWPNEGTTNAALSGEIRDRHFLLAHRHRISLIDANDGPEVWPDDAPRPGWLPRLTGELFTPAHGYAGPGEGAPNGVFSIGTYGTWGWQDEGQTGMWAHTDAWAGWLATNAPGTEAFLYLVDESSDYPQIEQWASWMDANPGPGSNLFSMATLSLPDAVAHVPSLDIPAAIITMGISNDWETAATGLATNPSRRLYLYNGVRPATGSFATEDDGIALRALAWAQHKKRVDRWFFWESTYYNNFQAGAGETRVLQSAATYGDSSETNDVLGETGWNHSNGDGVLFYPGTDRVYPEDSYGVPGPFASLRLKLWRRGLQDADYLAMAARMNPTQTAQIVQRMVPKVCWEYGVADINDPTWCRTDISWSVNPDDWEAARAELAGLIKSHLAAFRVRFAPSAGLTWADLGPGYAFTLQSAASLAAPAWTSAPGAWPARTNEWAGLGAGTAAFFRVQASPLAPPGR